MAIDRQILAQFCRYLGVGGSTALVYLGLILVTVQLLHLGHMLAVSISYFCAIAFHFLANKIFTFQSRHGKVIWEILRYIPAALLNYGITLAVVFLVVDWGHGSTYLGALLAIAVTQGIGYGMTKFWVFNHDRGSL